MITNIRNLEIGRNILHLMKNIHNNLQLTSDLKVRECPPVSVEYKAKIHSPTIPFSSVLQVLVREIRGEKESKLCRSQRKKRNCSTCRWHDSLCRRYVGIYQNIPQLVRSSSGKLQNIKWSHENELHFCTSNGHVVTELKTHLSFTITPKMKHLSACLTWLVYDLHAAKLQNDDERNQRKVKQTDIPC